MYSPLMARVRKCTKKSMVASWIFWISTCMSVWTSIVIFLCTHFSLCILYISVVTSVYVCIYIYECFIYAYTMCIYVSKLGYILYIYYIYIYIYIYVHSRARIKQQQKNYMYLSTLNICVPTCNMVLLCFL